MCQPLRQYTRGLAPQGGWILYSDDLGGENPAPSTGHRNLISVQINTDIVNMSPQIGRDAKGNVVRDVAKKS